MSMRHPALTALDKKLEALDRLPEADQPQALADLKRRIDDESSALSRRLLQPGSSPAQMSEDDIQRLHDLEIVRAYLQSSDIDNPVARNRVEKAIEWRTPTGDLTLAGQFKRIHDHAVAGAQSSRDSVTIKIEHSPFG